jgi:transposase-like protein
MRKRYPSKFKAKVALEAMKEDQTMAELSAKFGVHRVQIQRWKNEALTHLPVLFGRMKSKKEKDDKSLIEELYKQIGKLKVENDWLKKKVEIIDG